MTQLLLLAVALTYGQPAPASQPATQPAVNAAQQKLIDETILSLREDIRVVEFAMRTDPQKRRECVGRRDALRRRIADLAAGAIIPVLQLDLLAVGQRGYLKAPQMIEQIVDADNMLVANVNSLAWLQRLDRGMDGAPYITTCRPGPGARLDDGGSYFVRWLWVTGVPTAGRVDGSPVELSGVFHVSGTRTYETADGASATVFVLEPTSPASP